MIIEPVSKDERAALLLLATATGLFSPEEAEGLLGPVLDSLARNDLPEGHAAVVCRQAKGTPAIGWSYFAPDPYAAGVLNLWWIGVHPAAQGSGAGKALLSHVEDVAAKGGSRVIVIETSDQPPLARARAFYVKAGYSERGRIPDFYGSGEAKVVFSRSLRGVA